MACAVGVRSGRSGGDGKVAAPTAIFPVYRQRVGGAGVVGFDWLWLGLALIADIASYGGGAYGNRERIPGIS